MTIPTIETERLCLRSFREGDLNDYYAQIGSDPDVMRYLRGGAATTREGAAASIGRILAHWENNGFGLWAIDLKNDPATEPSFVGYCGLMRMDNTEEVEIAYGFGKSYWGRGFAPESGAAVLRYGFEEVGLDQIVAVAVPENLASQRVMVKIGMVPQGTRFVYGSDLAYCTLTRAQFTPSDAPYTLRK